MKNKNNELIKYESSKNIYEDVSNILEQAQKAAYRSVNIILIQRNWLIGKRIVEEELKETRKENYGQRIIENLSKKLVKKYGKGFNRINLYFFVMFYKNFTNIFDSASKQSFLTWTHYRVLLQIHDKEARDWYMKEASNEFWSVRTLQRNISSDYYHRLLSSQKKDITRKEMINLTKSMQDEKLEFVKNPVILEFLGIPENNLVRESQLEKAIINHIQSFLMELGKGYCFIGRQVRIHTEKEEYYIDLVFFNYILNCFVLIDLKTSKITHQDIGQMDMYVRMYDELIKEDFHNPTLGIVLCSETDEDIAKYSILKGNEQLFASKYKLCLPSEEVLRNEIENQKTMYRLKHNKV